MALFSHFTEKDIEAQGNKKYCLSLFGLQGAELEFKSTKKKNSNFQIFHKYET